MKRIIIVTGVVLVVIIAFYALWGREGEGEYVVPGPTEEVSNLTFSGEVIDVNAEQTKFDGPYLIAVREKSGNEIIISAPARGWRACAEGADLADPYSIKKGMMVEVSGALTFDGNIVPCESPTHYLRIITSQ